MLPSICCSLMCLSYAIVFAHATFKYLHSASLHARAGTRTRIRKHRRVADRFGSAPSPSGARRQTSQRRPARSPRRLKNAGEKVPMCSGKAGSRAEAMKCHSEDAFEPSSTRAPLHPFPGDARWGGPWLHFSTGILFNTVHFP